MRILALETSTRQASVALLESGRVVQLVRLPATLRTAQTLAPAMQNMLAEAYWPAQSIQLVALTEGPGSFTGLRIAVTTAKVFAYAADADVLGLNTLEVLVSQLPESVEVASAVMPAQRGEWFAAQFRRVKNQLWETRIPCTIVRPESWIASLEPGCILTGPAVGQTDLLLPKTIQLASSADRMPRADSVGRLAYAAYQAGRRDDIWNLTPQYYRPSYAEEKQRPSRRADAPN